jgi:hypothetical protein
MPVGASAGRLRRALRSPRSSRHVGSAWPRRSPSSTSGPSWRSSISIRPAAWKPCARRRLDELEAIAARTRPPALIEVPSDEALAELTDPGSGTGHPRSTPALPSGAARHHHCRAARLALLRPGDPSDASGLATEPDPASPGSPLSNSMSCPSHQRADSTTCSATLSSRPRGGSGAGPPAATTANPGSPNRPARVTVISAPATSTRPTTPADTAVTVCTPSAKGTPSPTRSSGGRDTGLTGPPRL